MSKTYRKHGDGTREPRFRTKRDEFRCRHCRMFVGLLPSGGSHRNHCPYCLYSRHVDLKTPGDRASDCGASMAPVGAFARAKGEQAVVHRCLGCGFERHCRVAADDDFTLVSGSNSSSRAPRRRRGIAEIGRWKMEIGGWKADAFGLCSLNVEPTGGGWSNLHPSPSSLQCSGWADSATECRRP